MDDCDNFDQDDKFANHLGIQHSKPQTTVKKNNYFQNQLQDNLDSFHASSNRNLSSGSKKAIKSEITPMKLLLSGSSGMPNEERQSQQDHTSAK